MSVPPSIAKLSLEELQKLTIECLKKLKVGGAFLVRPWPAASSNNKPARQKKAVDKDSSGPAGDTLSVTLRDALPFDRRRRRPRTDAAATAAAWPPPSLPCLALPPHSPLGTPTCSGPRQEDRGAHCRMRCGPAAGRRRRRRGDNRPGGHGRSAAGQAAVSRGGLQRPPRCRDRCGSRTAADLLQWHSVMGAAADGLLSHNHSAMQHPTLPTCRGASRADGRAVAAGGGGAGGSRGRA